MKRLLQIMQWSLTGVVGLVLFSNLWIVQSTQMQIFDDTNHIPQTEVAIVLGTSKQLVSGKSNPFFDERMKAAARLVKSKRVSRLLLSGSRDSIYYDEAKMMAEALVNLGVSNEIVVMDKQGNRTLESISRLYSVHGHRDCVIITQKNHAYRALFIANHLGIKAVCYEAVTPPMDEHYSVMIREVFARTKAVLDLFVLGA